jgi:hypothetical protein
VIDDDIRPGHSANEPMTSPVPAFGRGSTVASSLRCQVERERRTASPGGSLSNRRSNCTRSRGGGRAGARWSNRCPV